MVAERRSVPKPRKKGRERLAESAEKSARTVRNKLRETPGGGDFLGGGCRLGNARKRGAAFQNLPAYAYGHVRIFSCFHETGSALSEAVWRPAPEKNRRKPAAEEESGSLRKTQKRENTDREGQGNEVAERRKGTGKGQGKREQKIRPRGAAGSGLPPPTG